MLLGVKTGKEVFARYSVAAVTGLLVVYGGWLINSEWSSDMRLWKAFGLGAFMMLWAALILGPMARIFPLFLKFLSWRREAGVVATVLALVHGYLVIDGWVGWDVWKFFGYQYFPQFDMYVRLEPGFGLANLMGIVALFFLVLLASTSLDRAVAFLGVGSWKVLHMFAYVVFYIIGLHVVYFSFIHFAPSLESIMSANMNGTLIKYPPNDMRFVYLFAVLSAFILQVVAFIRTVYTQRSFSRLR